MGAQLARDHTQQGAAHMSATLVGGILKVGLASVGRVLEVALADNVGGGRKSRYSETGHKMGKCLGTRK